MSECWVLVQSVTKGGVLWVFNLVVFILCLVHQYCTCKCACACACAKIIQ